MNFSRLYYISICFQKRTVRKSQEEKPKPKKESDIVRERIIRRAALEFEDGMYGILWWKCKQWEDQKNHIHLWSSGLLLTPTRKTKPKSIQLPQKNALIWLPLLSSCIINDAHNVLCFFFFFFLPVVFSYILSWQLLPFLVKSSLVFDRLICD